MRTTTLLLLLMPIAFAGCNEQAGWRGGEQTDENQISQTTEPPRFRLEYESLNSNFLGTITAYYLLNTGRQSENIKWIAINNREDCVAVPLFSSDGRDIFKLAVIDGNDTAEIADYLSLNVGERIWVDFPSGCGKLVRITVGTDRGEFELASLF